MYLDYSKLAFDKNGTPETPTLVLKTMHEETIGVIPGVYNLKLSVKFAEPSEMTFDVPAILDGEKNWIYDELVGYKVIYTEHYGTMICTKPERNAATVFVGRIALNVLRCTCSLEQHADDVYCLSENGFRVHMYISRFQSAARPALLMHRESKTVKSTRFIPRRYFYRCIVLR